MAEFKKISTPKQIAKKHNVSLDAILKQLAKGKKVEKEHTTQENIAQLIALHHLGELPDYYTKLQKIETMKEDLRNWFNPKHPDGGWKRINSKGEAIGPCARGKGEGKPKCMSNKKRSQLTQKERAAAVAAKRKHDPVADRKGKGGKPVNVSNFGKGRISEAVQALFEKNKPTNPKLWSKAKSLARSKFDVYPSAYANGWAAKWYKSKGGGWKSVNENKLTEDFPMLKAESPEAHGSRMLPRILRGDFAGMDVHDRVHGALAYINHIKDHYKGSDRNIHLILKGRGDKSYSGGGMGYRIHGVGSGKGKSLKATPTTMGGRHRQPEEKDIGIFSGLQVSSYPNLKPEHTEVLRKLMNFKEIRENQIKNIVNLLLEAKKSKKPYKGFKKGKNHPEGGLSRAEARRQGIHAGIETKREAQKKGGFGKLSGKTQKRRKSFCGRMCGMKRKRTSSKTARDPKSKINAALRVWGCRCENYCNECENNLLGEQMVANSMGGNFSTGQVGTPNPNLAGYDSILPTPKTKHKIKNALNYMRRRKSLAEDIIIEDEIKNLRKLTKGIRLRGKPGNVVNDVSKKVQEERDSDIPQHEIDRSMDHFMQNYAYWRQRYGSAFNSAIRRMAVDHARKRMAQQAEAKKRGNVTEEIVNSSNAGTMSKSEIKKRDKTAKKVKPKPIKGDTEEESKYRIATYITLRSRGGKKNK
jgi:hypothetical protein